MARKLEDFADDFGTPDVDNPDGFYLDETGSEPGTSIKADGKNQIYYFFSRLMDSVSAVFSGVVDNFTTSQFFDALTTLIDNIIFAGIFTDNVVFKTKKITTTWDMNGASSKSIAHGLSDWTKALRITVLVKNDTDSSFFDFAACFKNVAAGAVDFNRLEIGTTNVQMDRQDGGFFDTVAYDDAEIVILIDYEA